MQDEDGEDEERSTGSRRKQLKSHEVCLLGYQRESLEKKASASDEVAMSAPVQEVGWLSRRDE